MWKAKQPKENKQMNEAIIALLGDVSHEHPEPVGVIHHLVHCAKVLSGASDGVKKDAASDIKLALGLPKNTKYADAASAALELLNSVDTDEGRRFTDPEGVGQMLNNLVVDEAEPEVNDTVVEEVVETVVVPTTTTQPSVEELVASAVAEATAGLMTQMQSMIASLSNATAPAVAKPKATPQPQPVVVEEADEESDESDSPFLIKPTWSSPKGWKDKQHFSVGIITDTIGTSTDGKYGCFTVKNVDAAAATQTARRLVLRQIVTAVDRVNGNKALTKVTQNDDWFEVAASHGITDAVIDSFITNPNTFLQQTRRTAEKMRERLGIDSAEAFGQLVIQMMDNPPQPAVVKSAPAPSTSLMDIGETTSASEAVATVDPAEVKAVMRDMGLTYAEAKAWLLE